MLKACYEFINAKMGFATFDEPSHIDIPLDAGRHVPMALMRVAGDGSLESSSVAYPAAAIRRAAYRGVLSGGFATEALALAQMRGGDDVFGFVLCEDGTPACASVFPASPDWREGILDVKTREALDTSSGIVGDWAPAVLNVLDRLPEGYILSQVDIPINQGNGASGSFASAVPGTSPSVFAKIHVRPHCIFARGLDASPEGASALLRGLELAGLAASVDEWVTSHPLVDSARSWELVLRIAQDGSIGDDVTLVLYTPAVSQGLAKAKTAKFPKAAMLGAATISPKAARFSEMLDELLTSEQFEKMNRASNGFKMPYLNDDLGFTYAYIYAFVESVSVTFSAGGPGQASPTIRFVPNGSHRYNFRTNTAGPQWHITDACDQRCKHCYIFAEDSGIRLTTTPFDRLVSILDEFEGLIDREDLDPNLVLTGGDPILHPRFWDFLTVLHDRGIEFSILGNPFHLTRDACDRLRALGCLSYQLSIDGLEEFHDSLRKPGSFKATCAAIPLLQDSGIEPAVMLTVSSANVDQVEDVARLCVKMRVGCFAFARYCPTNAENARELHIEPDRYKQLLYRMLDLYAEYRAKGCFTKFSEKEHLFTLAHWERGEWEIPESAESGAVYDGCHCGQHFCILPNCDVMACRRMESVMGNLDRSPLLDILQSPEHATWLEVDGLEKCSKCELLGWCRGCLAVGAGYTGDWHTADPQCWK